MLKSLESFTNHQVLWQTFCQMTLYDITRGTVSTADNINLVSISAYFANAFRSEDTKPTIGAMPKHCVAGGCSKGSEGGFSHHAFPKDPVRRKLWSDQIAIYRSDWTGPTEHSTIRSLHFNKECYEISLAEDMGLPSKRRQLKETAVPTLFPMLQMSIHVLLLGLTHLSTNKHCRPWDVLASANQEQLLSNRKEPRYVYTHQCLG